MLFHTNGNAEKRWQNFLLTNLLGAKKKMAKILQAVKKMTKFTVFWGFGVLGLYRLFRGVGIGWTVFEQTEHWLPRYARLKVGKWKWRKKQ